MFGQLWPVRQLVDELLRLQGRLELFVIQPMEDKIKRLILGISQRPYQRNVWNNSSININRLQEQGGNTTHKIMQHDES